MANPAQLEPLHVQVKQSGAPQIVVEGKDTHVAPFLRLPAEIRNQIWVHLLGNHHIHIRMQNHSKGQQLYHHVLQRNHFPLMSNEILHRAGPSSLYEKLTPVWLVNRALYHETRHIPFSPMNCFSFEDEGVIKTFLAQASPQQLDGMTHLWLVGDQQSANAMEILAPCLRSKDSAPTRDMTIYIPSRCNRLEARATDTSSGAMHITERLRAGWELASERKQVDGLMEIWQELVDTVVVVELEVDIRTQSRLWTSRFP